MADDLPESQVKRPLGVTIVAAYWLLGAGLFLLVLVVGPLHPAGSSGFFSGGLGEDVRRAQAHFGVQVLLIGIFAAIGLGLWFLQPLARTVVLVITGIHLALQAIKLLRPVSVSPAAPSRPGTVFFWFTTTISAAIFLYMCLPQVKRAFTRL